MRQRKYFCIALSLVLALSFMSCAGMTGPEKDVVIKITARRIAFYGFKLKPDMFTSLGEISKQSCEQTLDQAQPIDIAFKVIVEAISTKMKDPLLIEDIKDVAELIGVKFDAVFTLLGVNTENLEYITLFVCSFSQGIEAAKKAQK